MFESTAEIKATSQGNKGLRIERNTPELYTVNEGEFFVYKDIRTGDWWLSIVEKGKNYRQGKDLDMAFRQIDFYIGVRG